MPAEYLKSLTNMCRLHWKSFPTLTPLTHTHTQTTHPRVCAYSRHRRLFLDSPFFLALRFVCESLPTIIIVTVNAARNEAKEKNREYFTHCSSGERERSIRCTDCSRCCVWVVLGKNEFSHQVHTSAWRCVCVYVFAPLYYAARLMVLLTSTGCTWVVCLLAAYPPLTYEPICSSLWHSSIQIRIQKKLLVIKNYARRKRFEVNDASDGPLAHTYYIKDATTECSRFSANKYWRLDGNASF